MGLESPANFSTLVSYFATDVSYTCKMFLKLTTRVNVFKLFSLSLTARQNKLECLSPARFFRSYFYELNKFYNI